MARRRFTPRRSGFRKPKRFIVVATEGRCTESLYLDGFRTPRDAVLQLEVLLSNSNKSRPKECLKRLMEYARKNKLEDDDQLWLMIDRDNWSAAELDEVARELAKRRNHHLALSNPCVEYWFLLHLQDHIPLMDSAHALRELKRHMPDYSKEDFDVDRLVAAAGLAVWRAERNNEGNRDPWPKTTGSHAYRLVRELLRNGSES